MTTDLEPGGPYSPERTKEAANLTADAIRYIIHATLNPNTADALEYPADVDAVLSALATMTMRLPQLLTQLHQRLTAMTETGHLEVVSGRYAGNPDVATDAVRMALDAAMARFGNAGTSLDSAHQVTSAMAWAGEEEGKADD
jgi:hypothetical protein